MKKIKPNKKIKSKITDYLIDFVYYWLVLPLILILFPISPWWYASTEQSLILKFILHLCIMILPLFATIISTQINFNDDKTKTLTKLILKKIKNIIISIYICLIGLILILYPNIFEKQLIIYFTGFITGILCIIYINNFFNNILTQEVTLIDKDEDYLLQNTKVMNS